MPAIELSPAKIEQLKKEIVPFASGVDMGYLGAAVVGNPDPVLRFLAQRGEEAYRIIEHNEPKAIGAARQTRDSRLLAEGSEVVMGSSGSGAAKMLFEFTISALKRIRNWSTVEARMMDAIYWGWRPMEIVWDTSWQWKRKTYYAIDRILEKEPEHFKFTKAGRHLVYVDPGTREFTIFDRPGDEWKWVICTYGSTDNPYGNALYKSVWLLQYAKSRFFELFARGMERSMGILKFSHGFNRPAAPAEIATIRDNRLPAETMAAVTSEIQDIVEILNSHNILIETGQWRSSFLSEIDFASGWIDAMNYIDDAISLTVATEVLSFREGKFSSRAQATTHDRSGNRTAVLDGRSKDDWVNTQVIEKLVRLNFGEVDQDDMPRSRSLIRNKPALNDVKLFTDMGAKVDGDKLARDYNVPLATEETESVLEARKLTTGPSKDSVEDADDAVREEDEREGRPDKRE